MFVHKLINFVVDINGNIADTGTSMSGISNALISPSLRATWNNLLCVTSGKMAKECLNGSVGFIQIIIIEQ
jgi:hypothetical protein